MKEYPQRLVDKVKERMALGEKPLAIFQHMMQDIDGYWVTCVKEGLGLIRVKRVK